MNNHSYRFLNGSGRRLLLLAGLLLGCLIPRPLQAQSGALLTVEPADQQMGPDDTATVTVRLQEVVDMYGVELRLVFDPAVVQVVDADDDTEGIQSLPGPVLNLNQGFLVANRADNEVGELLYAATLLAPAEPINGDGILLVATFRGIEPGISALDLTTSILATADGQALSLQVEGAQIAIAAPGEVISASPTVPGPEATETQIAEIPVRETAGAVSEPPATGTPAAETPAAGATAEETVEAPTVRGTDLPPEQEPASGQSNGEPAEIQPAAITSGTDTSASEPVIAEEIQVETPASDSPPSDLSPDTPPATVGVAAGVLIEEPAAEEGDGILSIVFLGLAFVVVAGGLFYGRRLLTRRE